MNTSELFSLIPLMMVGGGILILIPVAAWKRNFQLAFAISTTTIIFDLAFIFIKGSCIKVDRASMLFKTDACALFFIGFFAFLALGVLLISYEYLKNFPGNKEEFLILILLGTLGGMVLAASNHFASFFLGLEILSVSLYGLIAYFGRQPHLEAGVKYLILASASSAFLLFGVALNYAQCGRLIFSGYGLPLIFVGLFFKLALVPFHLWTADVYEGAPAPVTAFIASISKGAVGVFLLRYIAQGSMNSQLVWITIAIVAIASMFVGNACALLQNNIKRILAYSSIAHIGYMMVIIYLFKNYGDVGGIRLSSIMFFYLIIYTLTNLGTFGIITAYSRWNQEMASLDDYRGLYWKQPVSAMFFTIFLFSLAGMPLTAGFVGKFLIFSAGIWSQCWWLLLILVVNSVVGLYYYLRIILTMSQEAEGRLVPLPVRLPVPLLISLGLMLSAILYLGIRPDSLLHWIQYFSQSLYSR